MQLTRTLSNSSSSSSCAQAVPQAVPTPANLAFLRDRYDNAPAKEAPRRYSASSSSASSVCAAVPQARPAPAREIPAPARETMPAIWRSADASTTSESLAHAIPKQGDADPLGREEFIARLEAANEKGVERVRNEVEYVEEMLELAQKCLESPALSDCTVYLGNGFMCDHGELLFEDMAFLDEVEQDFGSYEDMQKNSNYPMGWSRSRFKHQARICTGRLKAAGCVNEDEENLLRPFVCYVGDTGNMVRAYTIICGTGNMPRDPAAALSQVYGRLATQLPE